VCARRPCRGRTPRVLSSLSLSLCRSYYAAVALSFQLNSCTRMKGSGTWSEASRCRCSVCAVPNGTQKMPRVPPPRSRNSPSPLRAPHQACFIFSYVLEGVSPARIVSTRTSTAPTRSQAEEAGGREEEEEEAWRRRILQDNNNRDGGGGADDQTVGHSEGAPAYPCPFSSLFAPYRGKCVSLCWRRLMNGGRP
jgi:hypothetical protein